MGKYGIDWPKVAQTSGFDPANATTLTGPWASNAGIAGVGTGEWGYSAGRLIFSETAGGATFPTGDVIIGSIVRIFDPGDSTRYTDFIVTDPPRVIDAPTGRLVALRAPQHGSGPGGNVIEWNNAVKPTSTVAGNDVNMMVDIAPPAFIPDAMWVVAEDTVVPANVPGIGGMPAHKGDIVQMIDTDGDALVDSYQILSSGHEVWEQLSTQPLDANAKEGDVFFNTDTHGIGTITKTTAPSYDPALPATRVLWTAAEVGAAWNGPDSVLVSAEAPPNAAGNAPALYGIVTQGGTSSVSKIGHTLTAGGPYGTLIDHLVPVGYLPPPDTLAIDYDPATGIARWVDENGPLPASRSPATTSKASSRGRRRSSTGRCAVYRHRSRTRHRTRRTGSRSASSTRSLCRSTRPRCTSRATWRGTPTTMSCT